MNKAIFLDIDGVMKSVRCYFDKKKLDNFNGGWDPLAVAIVNRLARRCKAGVVFNTTWNLHGDGLEVIARNEGLIAPILGMTQYPSEDDRLEAIKTWLTSNPSVTEWVSLDDAPIDHPHAILVDSEVGVTPNDYREATGLLGNPDGFLVLL